MLLLVKHAVLTLSVVVQSSSATVDKSQVQETTELVWVADEDGYLLGQVMQHTTWF